MDSFEFDGNRVESILLDAQVYLEVEEAAGSRVSPILEQLNLRDFYAEGRIEDGGQLRHRRHEVELTLVRMIGKDGDALDNVKRWFQEQHAKLLEYNLLQFLTAKCSGC